MATHHQEDHLTQAEGIAGVSSSPLLDEASLIVSSTAGLHQIGDWEVYDQVGLSERDLHRLTYGLMTAERQLAESPVLSASEYDPTGACILMTDKAGRTVERSGKTEFTDGNASTTVISSEEVALADYRYPSPTVDVRETPKVSLDLVVRITQNSNLNSALIRGAAFDKLLERTNSADTIVAIGSAESKTVQIYKLEDYPVIQECRQFTSRPTYDLTQSLLDLYRAQDSSDVRDVCRIRTNVSFTSGKAKNFPAFVGPFEAESLQNFLIGPQSIQRQKLGAIALASKSGVPSSEEIDAIYEAARVNTAKRILPVLLWAEDTHTLFATTPEILKKAKHLLRS